MPRRRNTGHPADRVLGQDLDSGFVGMNDRLNPALLRQGAPYYAVNQELAAPGLYAAGHNVRCADGEIATRPGHVEVPHFNPTAMGGLAGAGPWTDPANGLACAALAAADGLWVCRDGTTPTQVPYPGSVNLPSGSEVDVVQALDRLFLFRGADLPTWVWDGDTGSTFRAVEDIPQTSGGDDYTDQLPDAPWAITVAGRIVAPFGRDQLAVSELLDYTRWDRALNTFRIGAGDEGDITAAAPYRRTRVVVFKRSSTHVLTGVDGDLSAIALEGVNSEVGCIARRSVAAVGGDLFWLGLGGVYRLSEVVELGMTAQEVPVSDDVAETLKRVNWAHAHKAAAAVHGRYYYLSLPVDGRDTPDTVLVYDTVSRAWQGTDTAGPASAPDRSAHWFVRAPYLGRDALLAVDAAGYVLAWSPGAGQYDRYGGNQVDIESSATTRGYVFGEMGFKKPRSVTLSLGTLGAELSVDLLTDGPAEEQSLVSGRTADPSLSLLHGVPPRALDNSNDDADSPGRADYTWTAQDDLEPHSGLVLGRHQRYQLTYPCRGRQGRWVAFRVSSARGSFRLSSVHADATSAGNQESNAA